jgi:Fe-S cluster assembly protein SufD
VGSDRGVGPDLPGLQAPCRVVFVNGFYAPELSAIPAGVTVGNLAEALVRAPEEIEAHLGRHAAFENHFFTALNTAFFHDGAYLRVPAGQVIEEPIHLIHLSLLGDEGALVSARNLIVAGENSQVTIVESYGGLPGAASLTTAVTEIVAEPAAVIDHYKVQQESEASFHLANTQVHQMRGSNFSTHFIGFGGKLVRNEVRVLLDGEGCEATINGLYRAGGTQHVDNLTVIDHARPHCSSHELYKGILDGKAKGVFNGKIFVRQDAQKTDAKQTNKTLLLSDDATINTKPQLEIYADDVKCTHGATVGQLDEEATFYLRTRGIGLAEARDLLTFAFANDVIGRMKVQALRDRLARHLLATQHLSRLESTEEPL